MLRIGLTGGIGSGKSTVARIFKVLGIPVYNADDEAKRLMTENANLHNHIISAFGPESYTDGVLNRKYLSAQVFNNSEKLNQLNSLVHPVTLKDADEWMKKQKAPYVIKEAALIFESGSQKMLDYVIGVKAPLALRIERTMERDNITSGEVESRINLQMNEDKKLSLCDHIIINDEKQMLIPQVLALHEKFLNTQP
jgi:dephospho-CoA kinase